MTGQGEITANTLQKHWLQDRELELQALLTERAGYEAENAQRARTDSSPAYGADDFMELAQSIRNLMQPQLAAPLLPDVAVDKKLADKAARISQESAQVARDMVNNPKNGQYIWPAMVPLPAELQRLQAKAAPRLPDVPTTNECAACGHTFRTPVRGACPECIIRAQDRLKLELAENSTYALENMMPLPAELQRLRAKAALCDRMAAICGILASCSDREAHMGSGINKVLYVKPDSFAELQRVLDKYVELEKAVELETRKP